MENEIDIWEEVLLKIGYTLSEERCGFQDTINCLVFYKPAKIIGNIMEKGPEEIRIYFDRTNPKFTTIHSNRIFFDKVEFMEFNKDAFRDAKLNQLFK